MENKREKELHETRIVRARLILFFVGGMLLIVALLVSVSLGWQVTDLIYSLLPGLLFITLGIFSIKHPKVTFSISICLMGIALLISLYALNFVSIPLSGTLTLLLAQGIKSASHSASFKHKERTDLLDDQFL